MTLLRRVTMALLRLKDGKRLSVGEMLSKLPVKILAIV